MIKVRFKKSIACLALVALFLFSLAIPAFADTSILGQWKTANVGTAATPLGSLSFCNGQFMSVSVPSFESESQQTISVTSNVSSYLLTSPDGLSWTNTPLGNYDIYNVTYGNGLYVAVGSNIQIVTSTYPVASPNPFGAPQYSLVPSVEGGAILTSADAKSWTSIPGISDGLYSIAYGNGIFVAVGATNINSSVINNPEYEIVFMTSADGKTWTKHATKFRCQEPSVCTYYVNGIFVMTYTPLNGNSDCVLTSTDGVNWTTQTLAANELLSSVVWGNGVFAAVAEVTISTGQAPQYFIATSPDGATWTSHALPAGFAPSDIAYGDGCFVTDGYSSEAECGEFLTSQDCVNWTNQSNFLARASSQVGFDYNYIFVGSEDALPACPGPCCGLIFANNKFLALAGGTLLESSAIPAPETVSGPSASLPTPLATASATSGQQTIDFVIGQGFYTVDGVVYAMDGAPLNLNGRSLVPVRYLADALGAQTAWDPSTQQVTVSKGDISIKMAIGRDTIDINGTVSQMDASPVVENGRTYLPARYIAEAFNDTVSWDAATQTVSIAGQ
jgi:hypothetical protein